MGKKIMFYLFCGLGIITIALVLLLNGLFRNISRNLVYAVPHHQLKEYRVAFIYQNNNKQFWQLVRDGARKAARGQSLHLSFMEANHGQEFQLTDYFRLAIDADYDGIVVDPGSERMLNLIRQAKEKKIPVVLVASDLPESGRLSYVGTNNYLTGFVAGKTLMNKLGESNHSGRKEFAVLTAITGEDDVSTSAADSLKVFGFREAISSRETHIPLWEKCQPTLFDSINLLRLLFNKHPRLNGLFITYPAGTVAAAKVLAERNMLSRVVVIGYGDTLEIQDYIRQGYIDASIVEYPYQIGFTAVNHIKDYLQDKLFYANKDIDAIVVDSANLDELKKRGALP